MAHEVSDSAFCWLSECERVDVQQRLDGREMTEAEHEEVRLKRIQEKNRRNQRKFRARQRVRATYPAPWATTLIKWPLN